MLFVRNKNCPSSKNLLKKRRSTTFWKPVVTPLKKWLGQEKARGSNYQTDDPRTSVQHVWKSFCPKILDNVYGIRELSIRRPKIGSKLLSLNKIRSISVTMSTCYDRQTFRQAGMQAGKQVGRHAERQAGTHAGKQTETQTDNHTHRQADKQTD